jgi:inorganic triphosphatase YgiF
MGRSKIARPTVSEAQQPRSNHPVEIELKLEMPAYGKERLERHEAIEAAEAPEVQRLVSTYFDTADLDLARLGFSLRVRRIGEARVQTVKALASDGGAAAQRGEWEWPVGRDRPDPALVARTPLGKLVPDLKAVEPVFTSDVVRAVRRMSLEDGTRIELAFDEGRITAGAREQPIHELELELREGRLEALYRFALRLHDVVPLAIGTESKADLGYALKTGRPKPAVGAPPIRLSATSGAAQGFRRLAGRGLAHLLANRMPMARGDAEGLHQMRVALRRLRATLVLFKPLLAAEPARRLGREFQALGLTLGTARDWDVLCLETLPAAMRAHETKSATKSWPHLLQQAAARQYKTAHEQAERAIGAPSFTTLVLSLALASESRQHGLLDDGKDGALVLGQLAPRLLDRAARKVTRRGKQIGRLRDADLHALRKSLKKLRYGIEDLASLYDRKAVAAYLDGCTVLQKILGRLNDAAVADRLVGELAGPERHDLASAAESFARRMRRQRKKERRKLQQAWSDFRAVEPFWRKTG